MTPNRPHNAMPHNAHYPYELSDSKGRVGCYSLLHTARDIAAGLTGYWVIRNLAGAVIEEG